MAFPPRSLEGVEAEAAAGLHLACGLRSWVCGGKRRACRSCWTTASAMMRSRAACLVHFSQPTLARSEMAARSSTPAGQPARTYPLKWIEDTFNSKEKTESLFRPEVENGNVTYHDLELAQASVILLFALTADEITLRIPSLQTFFSSKKRYLPVCLPIRGHPL